MSNLLHQDQMRCQKLKCTPAYCHKYKGTHITHLRHMKVVCLLPFRYKMIRCSLQTGWQFPLQNPNITHRRRVYQKRKIAWSRNYLEFFKKVSVKALPLTKPCQCRTWVIQSRMVRSNLSEKLFLYPSYEMLESPIRHLLCSYDYPCQKLEHPSNKEPPIVLCPLHLTTRILFGWYQTS